MMQQQQREGVLLQQQQQQQVEGVLCLQLQRQLGRAVLHSCISQLMQAGVTQLQLHPRCLCQAPQPQRFLQLMAEVLLLQDSFCCLLVQQTALLQQQTTSSGACWQCLLLGQHPFKSKPQHRLWHLQEMGRQGCSGLGCRQQRRQDSKGPKSKLLHSSCSTQVQLWQARKQLLSVVQMLHVQLRLLHQGRRALLLLL